MMPGRYLRDGILTSEPVNSLEARTELFYRRLLSVVDDFGRYYGSPKLLRPACYPLQIDRIREADISRWLIECEQAGLLLLYAVDGKEYLQVFKVDRARAKASKYPNPPHSSGIYPQMPTDAGKRPQMPPIPDTETIPIPETNSNAARLARGKPAGASKTAETPENSTPSANPKGPEEPASAKFPPGVWKRASDGWAAAFRHVHGSEFLWNSRQGKGLKDVLVALKGDVGKFEKVAKAWLVEPETGKTKGHPLYQLAEDLNYVLSKIAKGTVGQGTNGRNSHEETPDQYAKRVAAQRS